MQNKITNYEDLIKAIRGDLVESLRQLGGFTGRVVEIDLNAFVDAVLNHTDPIYEDRKDQNIRDVMFYDPIRRIYTNDPNYLVSLIVDVIATKGPIRFKCSNDFDFANRVYSRCVSIARNNIHNRIRARNVNPTWIVMCRNVAVDRKKNVVLDIDKVESTYDFISRHNLDYLMYDDLSSADQKRYDDELSFINARRDEWSDNKSDWKLTQDQFSLAVIEGDNRGLAWLSKSPGGSGKTMFANAMKRFASDSQNAVVIANLDQYGDDNAINTISMSTHLILGDDLSTRLAFKDKPVVRLKSFTGGGSVKVSRKYMDSYSILTKAVILQNINTDPTLYEHTRALLDRIAYLPWTQRSFRQTKLRASDSNFVDDSVFVASKKLERFIDDDFCMSVWFTDLMKLPYFEKFTIPDEFISNVEELVESNDIVGQVINDTIKELDGFSRIPLEFVYDRYVDIVKTENPGSRPMKLVNFRNSFSTSLSGQDLKMSTSRVQKRLFPDIDVIANILKIDHIKSQFHFIELSNPLTSDELDHLKSRVLEGDYATNDFSFRDMNALRLLEKNDIENSHVYRLLLNSIE